MVITASNRCVKPEIMLSMIYKKTSVLKLFLASYCESPLRRLANSGVSCTLVATIVASFTIYEACFLLNLAGSKALDVVPFDVQRGVPTLNHKVCVVYGRQHLDPYGGHYQTLKGHYQTLKCLKICFYSNDVSTAFWS